MSFNMNLFWCYIVLIYIVEIQSSLSVPQNLTNILKYDPKIVGGELATFDGTKHLVSIRLKDVEKYGFGYGHICGASVIGPRKILTAAHCFLKFVSENLPPTMRTADEFTLVMGTLDRTKKDKNTFQSNVVKIIAHENFSILTMENDIAIMILEKEIPESSTVIKPISLVEENVPTDTKCRVDGWGAEASGAAGTAELLTVNITTIDREKCKTSYSNRLKDGMFCAGDWAGGKDSCQGDSGGPLSCNGELVGVVSWGEYCAVPTFPGIYTDVVYFKEWIAKNSGNKITNGIFIIISMLMLFIHN